MFIYSPSPHTDVGDIQERFSSNDSSEFFVRSSKDNVDELANAYIDKLLTNTNQSYHIELNDDVELHGELPFFSTSVPLLAHFEPDVQENGDIILKQKSISIGNLKLPNRKIMQYIKNYLPVPPWVVIQPDEQQVYVKVTAMNIRSNLKVGVEHFDLEKDNISFRINIPYKTLGIDDLDKEMND